MRLQPALTCSLPTQDLFAYIDDVSGKLSEAESELCDKRDVIKLTRDRIQDTEKQIQALQLEKVRWTDSLFVPLGTDFRRIGTFSFRF
jgi:hypothetical protein